MGNGSFIKIYRKLEKWEWYKDANTKSVFLHLLLKANYEDKIYHGTTVKRGQCIVSRRKLAESLGLSEQQIRTAFQHLLATHEITQNATRKYTIVTIEKYDDYQGIEEKPTNKSTHKATTPKEIKEIKNIYIDDFEVFYGQYCNSQNKAKTYSGWQRAVNEYSVVDILKASQNYAESVVDREKQYKKSSSNFVGEDKFYLDYLPGVYQEPLKPYERRRRIID